MSDEPRPAHGSALGHGIGLGGNGLLWALGTYGWGIAAAIGGVFGIFALGSMAKRRRSSRRGGAGGRTGGGKGLGGGLWGLFGGKRGGGKSGGGRGGSRSGLGGKGSKSGKGGFLQRMKERRSTSPNGRGGIPGRGGAPKGAGKGKGLLGAGRPGHTPSGSSSKRGDKGSNRPGGRNRSRNNNSPGSKQRTRNRTPGGGRLRNLLGGGGRNRNKTKRPGSATKNRGKSRARHAMATVCGPSKDWLERRRKAWLDRRKNKAKKNPEKATGWEEAPTRTKGKEMTAPAPKPPTRTRTTRKAPSPRAATTGASSGGRGGHFTAGAEQFAQTLSKPGAPVDTVKGMDRALDDLGNSMTVVGGGLKNFRTVMEDAMPDEGALHDQIGQYAQQLAQIAEGINLMRADQHRRNAADHERIDNNRKNETGYDYTKNKD